MSEMKAVAGCLLNLPMKIKQKTVGDVIGKGYLPPTETSPLYESLGVYDIALPEAFQSFCDHLNASTHKRETILRYSKAVEELGMDIGGKLVEALGLDIPEFMKGWPCQFRMQKYNFTSKTVGSNGATMHSDLSYLTILQDDESVGGLELVDKQSGELIDVEPSSPGILLVVVGDIAKVWSNGRSYNVKHQVQNKEGKPRVSVATFFLGPKEAKVEAPLELVGSDLPHLYVPFGVEEYRMLWISTRSASGEALEHFRTTSSIKI